MKRSTRLNHELNAVAAAVSKHGSAGEWLQQRYDGLNATEPQIDIGDLVAVGSTRGVAPRRRWIPMAAVFAADTHDGPWGVINNRPLSMIEITNGLIDPLQSRAEWLRRMDGITMIGVAGPHGEVWRHTTEGRHRLTALKAFGVTEWKVDALSAPLPSVGDLLSFNARRWAPDQPFTGVTPPRRLARRVKAHLALLVDAGVIGTPQVGQSSGRHEYIAELHLPLTASWELESPERVAGLSQRYRRAYPRFGSTRREAAMLDAQDWVDHLKSRAVANGADPSAVDRRKRWWRPLFT